MAKVVIDTCVTSVDWFKNQALRELVSSENVDFVYSNHKKFLSEMKCNGNLMKLIKLMSDKGRCKLVPEDECSRHVELLEGQACWIDEGACDDPHIFAVIAVQSTRYVFSTDARMAACRQAMRGQLKAEYLRFIVIGSLQVYRRHRARILS